MDFNKRITKLRGILKEKKVDVFVLVTREGENRNIEYLSGFSGTAAILLITERDAFLAVDPRYTERAARESLHCKRIDLTGKKDLRDAVSEALGGSLSRRMPRIGYEGFRVSVLTAARWQKHIAGKFIPLEDVIANLRQYKDADEIREVERACRVTSAVFREVTRRMKPGITERDVARDIDNTLRNRGAADNSFDTIVASGPNSAIPHHKTGERKIRAGEPVVIDFGGRFPSGYCSDLTRTVFVRGKKPDPELLSIYDVVLGANRAAFRALRAGMSWKQYDAAARTYITERGYGEFFTHSLGHSLGLEAHDPCDYPGSPLRPGSVFTNEPGIYLLGRGGVRIEDNIVLTRTGPKRLTGAPYETHAK